MGSWLGLDVGTSSLKALLVADDGTVLARSSADYADTSAPGGGPVAEQDPTAWIAAARAAIADCVAAGGRPDGVGLAGQVPTLVLVDHVGAAVRSALTWQDSRAVDAAAALAAELGDSRAHLGIDLPWAPSHLPAKLRWLATHEPQLITRARWALQPKDHLGMVLTGSPLTDAWSSKGLCNVSSGAAATAVLEACGWPAAICPATAAPWTSRGVVRGDGLGLPAGIPVSVGWSDALAAMLAVGAFSAPSAFVLSGTSDIAGLSQAGEAAEARGLYRVPTACAPLGLLYGPTQSSGATLEWLARLLGTTIEELGALAADAGNADRIGGAAFVPYLSGERAPLWRTDVRGLVAGLAVGDGAPELARAVLRGVALSASHVLDVAATATGARICEIHVAGRGLHAPIWQRVRLETLGVPLLLHEEPFTSALGAAMLGAAAAHDGDLAVAEPLRRAPRRIEPRAGDHERSAALLADYLRASGLAQAWSAG
jgi:xylulokinase